MGETVVIGKKVPGPMQEEKSQPATETTLDKDAITTFVGPGQSNPYKALNLLPSVNAEGTDHSSFSGSKNRRFPGKTWSFYPESALFLPPLQI